MISTFIDACNKRHCNFGSPEDSIGQSWGYGHRRAPSHSVAEVGLALRSWISRGGEHKFARLSWPIVGWNTRSLSYSANKRPCGKSVFTIFLPLTHRYMTWDASVDGFPKIEDTVADAVIVWSWSSIPRGLRSSPPNPYPAQVILHCTWYQASTQQYNRLRVQDGFSSVF